MAIGGYGTIEQRPRGYQQTISSYDLITGTWAENSRDLNQARAAAGSCLTAGQIYVFGGVQGLR